MTLNDVAIDTIREQAQRLQELARRFAPGGEGLTPDEMKEYDRLSQYIGTTTLLVLHAHDELEARVKAVEAILSQCPTERPRMTQQLYRYEGGDYEGDTARYDLAEDLRAALKGDQQSLPAATHRQRW